MAAYFLNTSAVVKRYIKETGSAWVRALADPLAAHLIYLARITDVEATSAVIRRQRGGTISPAAAATMLRQFRQDQALGYRIIDTDDGLAYAQFLSGLETLGLNETHITDESLKRIRQSTTIRVLSLKYTQVTDKGMIYLSHLSSLNELHLDVTGVGDSGIAH